jgi:hypothetical protein
LTGWHSSYLQMWAWAVNGWCKRKEKPVSMLTTDPTSTVRRVAVCVNWIIVGDALVLFRTLRE